jgi:hypothetical protein
VLVGKLAFDGREAVTDRGRDAVEEGMLAIEQAEVGRKAWHARMLPASGGATKIEGSRPGDDPPEKAQALGAEAGADRGSPRQHRASTTA